MKDEEMAEERLANESWFSEDNGYRIMTNEGTYIYAFKKGLKAGRPQWHDLRKDPNDLPPCNEYGVSTAKMTDKGVWAIYKSSMKTWYTKLSETIEVYQWCDFELPKEIEK